MTEGNIGRILFYIGGVILVGYLIHMVIINWDQIKVLIDNYFTNPIKM